MWGGSEKTQIINEAKRNFDMIDNWIEFGIDSIDVPRILEILTFTADAKALLQRLSKNDKEVQKQLEHVTLIMNKLKSAVEKKFKAAERLHNQCKSDLAELREVQVALKEAASKAQLERKRCATALQALQAVKVAPTKTKSKTKTKTKSKTKSNTKSKIVCKAKTSNKPGFISSVELRKRAKEAGIPVTKRKKKDICEDFMAWLEQQNR